MPRAIFGIPPPAHTFNPESLPDFALKSRIPSFRLGKSRTPENLMGTLRRGWRDCHARGVVLAFSATFNHVIKIASNRS